MNKQLRYKLDTVEIIAFIIGVVIIIGLNKFLFSNGLIQSQEYKTALCICAIAFIATMFGMISGGLTGMVGTLCSMAVCGEPMNFAYAITYAVYGCMLGQFADRYLIREGKYSFKQAFLWLGTHFIALISSFVFIKPLVEYIFYDSDLITDILIGTRYSLFCALPLGIALSIIFFVISSVSEYVKKQ